MSKSATSDITPEATPLTQWRELDLTAAAAAGRLAPAFEVDGILEQVNEVLGSGRIPVLAGEPGVGKTAIVHELVRRLAGGGGPSALRGRSIAQFSLQRLVTSIRDPRQVGAEVHKLLDAIGAQLGSPTSVVPFFRDLHLADQLNVAPAFQSLALRVLGGPESGSIIAEAEGAAFNRLVEDHPDLQQFYVPVLVDEPAPDRVQRILQAWISDQQARGGSSFDARALDAAIALSHRFLPRDRQPRKAIDLLRQVGSLVGSSRTASESDVIDRFCRSHHVPRVLVDPNMPLDLAGLEHRFRAELLGQPEAVESLLSLVAMVKAGLSDLRRPFGVFLFVGPTGVGKTHAAQLLAEYLFGGRDRVVRLNMADHADERAATVLFGDPEGYRPQLIRGVLTTKLGGRPFAVLLLDEFEKAHHSVHDRFLQLFDEGTFINAANETVNCRSMIIIATSNAGAELYRSRAFGFAGIAPPAEQRSRENEIERVLQVQFRFEFLNRFDRIVHFRPLSRADIRTIALRELDLLRSRFGLRQRSLELEIDESLLDWLAVHGYDPDNGARFLRRAIERHVVTAVAEAIVRDNPGPGRSILLTVRAARVAARILPVRASQTAEPRLAIVLPAPIDGKQTARLDRAGLRAEAESVLAAAAPFAAALERRRAERSALLEEMNHADFWSVREKRGPVLDRFRELDVAVRTDERLAAPIDRLRELLEGVSRSDAAATERMARQLELAADSLREWERRAAEDGPAAAWLVISSADPTHPVTDWIADLTRMELAWCRRLHLSAELVAFEPGLPNRSTAAPSAVRTALAVDGPGVESLLEMERGIHRLRRAKHRDAKARIDLIVRGPAPTDPLPGLRSSPPRAAVLGLKAAWQAELELPGRAFSLGLHGGSRDILAHLVSDLASAWSTAPAEEPAVARIYGDDGGWVRDPRTDASAAVKLKEALRGRLEPLLEAWRRRSTMATA